MEEKYLENLSDIKRMMERSSRFLSLSGLSGIAAGICGLGGAFWAKYILDTPPFKGMDAAGYPGMASAGHITQQLLLIAVITLVCAVLSGFLLTYRKAKRQGMPVWDVTSRKLLLNLSIPLVTGGLFILGMLQHQSYHFAGAASLVFYGLALVNASKYTLSDIRYLGLLEILLGILCLYFSGFSLYFWAMGFGVLHIIYGVIMWKKYA